MQLHHTLFGRMYNLPRLTLLGRSVLLISSELLANAICWVVAGILFGGRRDTQPILSLALLAWTIGLRHALDADHISAIDNATRGLMNSGQLSVTCGLFFSLGHSTIVVAVNVAIAISTDIYDKLGGVGNVGAIVGSAVSGSFLFVIGLANTIILVNILKKRHHAKKQRAEVGKEAGCDQDMLDSNDHSNGMLMMRIIGPIITFVDRPWKMYPVGVLFGLGFDTASSIALLAVSALAKKGPDGHQIPPGYIVILPLLFTTGMTLIDSLDSILMLYSYAGFPERGWALFETSKGQPLKSESHPLSIIPPQNSDRKSAEDVNIIQLMSRTDSPSIREVPDNDDQDVTAQPTDGDKLEQFNDGQSTVSKLREDRIQRDLRVKRSTMSSLSIMLTVMSILVAYCISVITIMGLIGDNCKICSAAAASRDSGLEGRWWRFWNEANNNIGIIGAGIVGSFVAVVCAWYAGVWIFRKVRGRNNVNLRLDDEIVQLEI